MDYAIEILGKVLEKVGAGRGNILVLLGFTRFYYGIYWVMSIKTEK